MKFDSIKTEEYFYNEIKKYGNIHMSPTKDMVWSKEKVDNFLNDLRKIHKGFNMNVTQ